MKLTTSDSHGDHPAKRNPTVARMIAPEGKTKLAQIGRRRGMSESAGRLTGRRICAQNQFQ